MNDDKPIYQQIISIIEDDILNGTYQADAIIISTTQIAKIYSVNPTTAVKAISVLTERGILYKQRGIGMAVTKGALEMIREKRRELFFNQQIQEFISSADKLGITREQLAAMILNENSEGGKPND